MHDNTVEIEYFEGERAERYDNFIPVVIPTYNQLIEQLPKLASAVVQHHDAPRLLVAGCGTGNEIVPFVRSSTQWHIAACDPSPAMVARAQEKLHAYPNVQLFTATVADMPQREKFDAATLLLVLHFLTDDGAKQNLLTSIAQRLHDGAPLFLVDICGTERDIASNLHMLQTLLPSEWPAEQVARIVNNIRTNIPYVSEPRLCELLAASGFTQPVRFYQSMMYHGWITTKAAQNDGVR